MKVRIKSEINMMRLSNMENKRWASFMLEPLSEMAVKMVNKGEQE